MTTEDQTNTVNVGLTEEIQSSVQETLQTAAPNWKWRNCRSSRTNQRLIMKLICKVEKPKLTKFKGDIRDYVVFWTDFILIVESRYSEKDVMTLTILRASLERETVGIN